MEGEAVHSADASAFVAKWRGAWPEWAIVDVFVPTAERAVAPYWQALQFELQEAAWGGADARPGEAKLGWWSEELAGWAMGRRRHPLGAHLTSRPAPWGELALALPALRATRGRPADAARAWSDLDVVSQAVAECEMALLGRDVAPRVVTACWLHARLARHPQDAVPADIETSDAWARALASTWPGARRASTTRRLELALARARLRSGRPAAPLGPVTTLWTGWRAARD